MLFSIVESNPAYEVSQAGIVRNVAYGRTLNSWYNKEDKRFMVRFFRKEADGSRTQYEVDPAKVVWETFVGPIPENSFIRFLNDDIKDCSLKNLECVSKAVKKFCVYYKQATGGYRVLYNTGSFANVDRLDKTFCAFAALKGYTKSDDSLQQFMTDFKVWKKEFYEHFGFVYKTSHDFMINALTKRYKVRADKDIVGTVEYHWIEQCFNAGILYCKPQTCQSFAYDKKSFYPNLLGDSDLKIPIAPGKEHTLPKLPVLSKRKHGYYHIVISSSNDEFRKLFAFSKSHVYCSYSVNFAMRFRKKYGVNVQLVQDGQPNCYLYDDSDMKDSKDTFGEWLKCVMEARKCFPNNRLLKHMSTSLWGFVCKFNNVFKYGNEIKDMEIGKCVEEDHSKYRDWGVVQVLHNDHLADINKSISLKLLNMRQPYKRNYRIKAFLTAYARNTIAELAKKDLKHVVRICTDCVVYDREQSDMPEGVCLESKTSGYIEWTTATKYKQVEAQ